MIAARRQEAETQDGAPDKSGPRRMLSEKQVLEIVPVGRTTLYRMEKTGRFLRSTYISPNRRVWYEDEIVAWQNVVDECDPYRGRGKGRRPLGSPIARWREDESLRLRRCPWLLAATTAERCKSLIGRTNACVCREGKPVPGYPDHAPAEESQARSHPFRTDIVMLDCKAAGVPGFLLPYRTGGQHA
jgi:prophage regulatory protein